MMTKNRISVLGAGAWGTALALHLHANGRNVCLWSRNPTVVESFQVDGRNAIYLPHARPVKDMFVTANLAEACGPFLVLASPSHGLRGLLESLKPLLTGSPKLLIVSKGLEISSRKFLTTVAAEVLPEASCSVLSGPSFASNLEAGEPTTVCIASTDVAHAWEWAELFGGGCLRPYVVEDIIGVQIGGAIKNVLAIANGVLMTAKLPLVGQGQTLNLTKGRENASAALLTRGLAEAARLCVAVGGDPQTLMGLSGIGDLMLTANSLQSRNTKLGCRLGQGELMADILALEPTVAEGVNATYAICDLANDAGVSMPVFSVTRALLNGDITPQEAVMTLMSRTFKHERV